MGKKKSRTSRQSQGVHGAPKGCKVSTGIVRKLNQLKAWSQGKRTRVSFNGEKAVEGREIWGLPPHERKRESNK